MLNSISTKYFSVTKIFFTYEDQGCGSRHLSLGLSFESLDLGLWLSEPLGLGLQSLGFGLEQLSHGNKSDADISCLEIVRDTSVPCQMVSCQVSKFLKLK